MEASGGSSFTFLVVMVDTARSGKNAAHINKRKQGTFMDLLNHAEKGQQEIGNANIRFMWNTDGWQSRHERICSGAEKAAKFLQSLALATEQAQAIVLQHSEWLSGVQQSWRIEKIEIVDKFCYCVHFRNYKKETFQLYYNAQQKNGKPWQSITTGDLLLKSGCSYDYLFGVMETFEFLSDYIFDTYSKQKKIYDFENAEKLFNYKSLSGDQTRKLFHVLQDKKNLEIILNYGPKEIIDATNCHLKTISSRKNEMRLKQFITNTCKFYEMSSPPGPYCKAKETFDANIGSGIYFLWNLGEVVYVGKSVNISNRLKSHHVVNAEDDVSWLKMSKNDIHLAELFYIWLLAPELNSETKLSRSDFAEMTENKSQ